MKKQINNQKVKEQDKCPPNQTKEEIVSLSEKEFRIMIVKMIQNLENKMELQTETRIENMQEMFNKDLEEKKIKKSQSVMNNAITETKSTLEGTNSRMTEAEYRMSEVEDRIVEINEAERKKELKQMRTTSETSQFSSVPQSCPTLCDPMNFSMPGLPVHHHLLEFTQTHVH